MIIIFLLKNSQNSFSWVPHLVDSGLQNTWILEAKAVRSEVCSVAPIQGTYKLRIVKNQVLLFLSSWESNLFDLMVYNNTDKTVYGFFHNWFWFSLPILNFSELVTHALRSTDLLNKNNWNFIIHKAGKKGETGCGQQKQQK